MTNKKEFKAILIDVISPDTKKMEAEKRIEELDCLTNTYGGLSIVKLYQKRQVPNYNTYIGKGKIQEILEIAKENEANLIIVNNILKPKQVYNLEEIFIKEKIKVWDRVDLILNIFDKHAKSSEAKLQVKLAAIKQMGPRISGMGEQLMRQEGRTGIRSGQGESNIELMKRHLRAQEKSILEKLKQHEIVKNGHRERRVRNNLKTASLVGYTNAGKSSVLNALTNKDVYIADELFATLDTRVGKLYIHPENTNPEKYTPGVEILISDTIGFIRDLPPALIQAFKSTLSETVNSDFILHVIDITDPDMNKKIQVVEEILEDLGLKDKPKIYVFNKIDLIDYTKFIKIPESEIKLKNSNGIYLAGQHTAKKLGWNLEDRSQELKIDTKHLKKKYKEFNPVFISAHKKINLDEFIDKIKKAI